MRNPSWMMVMLAVSIGCAGGDLEFKRGSTVVASTKVLTGTQYIPADNDIAGARNTCADELTAALKVSALNATKVSDVPRSELHLYARSPAEMVGFLSSLTDGDVQAGLGHFAKSDAQRWHPDTVAAAGFSDAVTVLWPATAGSTGGAATTRALSTTEFFSGGLAAGLPQDVASCHPQGNQGASQAGASVKTAIVYNRGTCRREIGLAPLLQGGNQQLVNALHTKLHLGIGSNTVSFSILQSMVSASAGIESPVQQLYLFLHYVARDLAGNAASDIYGAVRYDFVLSDDGRISVAPHELRWDHGGIWGQLSSEGAAGQEGWHHAMTQPDGGMVEKINATILEQQLLGVQSGLFGASLAGGNYDCDDQTFARQCGAAATWLAGAIRGGMQSKFNATEVQHMLCAVGDAASCTALGVDAATVLSKRWVCMTSAASSKFGQGQRYCDMIVPVARVVAMPDAMGAVFFDRDDVDSAAYALQAGTSALCDKDSDNVPARRSFAAAVFRD